MRLAQGVSRIPTTYVWAILATLVALGLSVISPLLSGVFLIVIAFVFVARRNAANAVLFLYVAKPIIDAAWDLRIPGVGLNFLQITGVMYPIFVLTIVWFNRPRVPRHPATVTWVIFAVWSLFAVVLFLLGGLTSGSAPSDRYIVNTASTYFQFLNSLSGFLIIPYFFTDRASQRRFVLALVVSGFFPIVVALLQVMGLYQGRVLRTTGELMRISGPYHDSTNLRMYTLQTMLAIIIYMTNYGSIIRSQRKLKIALLAISMPICLLIVYRGYSKASVGIVVLWFLLYALLRRNYKFLLVGVLVVAIWIPSDSEVIQNLSRLFQKELWYTKGELAEEVEYTLLGGRLLSWGSAWDDFQETQLVDQMIGVDFLRAPMLHNDFLRTLVASGYVGLGLYVVLLIQLGLAVWKCHRIKSDGLSMGAMMAFAAFLIECLGLVPLLYPGYCWQTFGLISLVLHSPDHNPKRHDQVPASTQ